MLIMTSYENHDETVNFITKQNNCFGLREDNFIFFSQAMLPALSDKGKILM
jgi:UDP-N-acetylglucosamine pyrophosphorylase